MGASLLRLVAATAIGFAVSAPMTPASAGACLQGCWPASNLGAPFWPDLFGDIHGGVLTRAVVGRYPENKHGFNSGHCIAYQDICDQAGNVIGRRPVVVC